MKKYLNIKPILATIKNPQASALVGMVHQVILNMVVTKGLYKKLFYYIYPWGENLESISWEIRSSYHSTIQATPGQSVFGRDTIFNLASVVDW